MYFILIFVVIISLFIKDKSRNNISLSNQQSDNNLWCFVFNDKTVFSLSAITFPFTHLLWLQGQKHPPFHFLLFVVLLPFSYMTLVPQLNPPTLCQAALLLMTAAPTWSNFLPAARGVVVTASGALPAACVNRALQGHNVTKVNILNYF